MDYFDDDIIDIESGEDNYYSDDDDNRESDYGLAEEDDVKQSQRSYVVLKEADIRKHQRDDIERVSTVLSISKVEAIVLLLHYHWSVSKVEEEWFTDEERVRKTVGILKEPIVELSNGRGVRIQCGICFESYRRSKIETVSCGHPYCKDCWRGYITTEIKDGPGCLMVKCPEPSCSAVVGQDMIDKVTKEEDKDKYYRFFLRSYIEDNGKKKWCPSPGCEYAVDFDDNGSGYDVTCLCSYSFCMNCSEEAHSPVDCDTVSKWILKNTDESENTNWILANSKPCPKCKCSIEKNQGCNHMTCPAPCKFEFCWYCLDPWKTDQGHDYYNCNKYKSDCRDEAEIKREMAKDAIDRYIHYYERWASNHSSRQKAIGDLEKLQSVQLKELSAKQRKPETELEFTLEAWLQIIECRRVLKWTYAYGYYLPELTHAKQEFFEYLQVEAESGLERLHYCAEKELTEFFCETENFDAFRSKLVGLTKVTKTYFENLVKALENGLSDVAYSESKSTSRKRQKLVLVTVKEDPNGTN